jgi:hypothetical protein
LKVGNSLAFDGATILIKMIFGDLGNPLALENFDPTQAYRWLFIDVFGAIDADFNPSIFQFDADTNKFLNSLAGGQFSVSRTTTDTNDQLFINFTPASDAAIPEPAALIVWSLLALTAGGAAWRRRSAP